MLLLAALLSVPADAQPLDEVPAVEGFGTPAELGIGSYHALLISAQDYAPGSGLPDLVTPNRDVARLEKVLGGQYGFEVTTLVDATYTQIIDALDRLKTTTGPDDAVLVYYAGHGMAVEDENRGYWLPVDAREDSTAGWVSTDDVAAKARAMPARHVLVIADSCFSGMLTRGLSVPESTEPPGYREARKLASQRSRWVITSGGDEPVSDGGADGMSVFAYHFVDALQSTPERYVVPDILFPALRRGVTENSAQTPQQGRLVRGQQLDGQFVLLNLQGCGDRLQVALREANDASTDDWEANVAPLVARDDDAYREAVEAWIGRWSGRMVVACEESHPVEAPQMAYALSLRQRLDRPEEPRSGGGAGRALAVTGGAMATAGASMMIVSGLWWDAHRASAVEDGGELRFLPDDERAFRRWRAINVAGGALAGVGIGLAGVGLVVELTDAGTPVVGARW